MLAFMGLGKALSSDKIVESKQMPLLISKMEGVKKTTVKAEAFGGTINGRSTTVVVIDDEEKGKEIGQRMVEEVLQQGNLRVRSNGRTRLVARSSRHETRGEILNLSNS